MLVHLQKFCFKHNFDFDEASSLYEEFLTQYDETQYENITEEEFALLNTKQKLLNEQKKPMVDPDTVKKAGPKKLADRPSKPSKPEPKKEKTTKLSDNTKSRRVDSSYTADSARNNLNKLHRANLKNPDHYYEMAHGKHAPIVDSWYKDAKNDIDKEIKTIAGMKSGQRDAVKKFLIKHSPFLHKFADEYRLASKDSPSKSLLPKKGLKPKELKALDAASKSKMKDGDVAFIASSPVHKAAAAKLRSRLKPKSTPAEPTKSEPTPVEKPSFMDRVRSTLKKFRGV